MAKSKAEFRAYIDDMKAKKSAAVRALADAFATSAAVIVTHRDGRRELWILSGNMGADKTGHRVTYFGADGPIGHTERDTTDEIFDDLYETGATYQPVGDDEVIAWTSTPEFTEGSKRVAYVQALNHIGWLISQSTSHDDTQVLIAAQTKAHHMDDVEKATAFLERVIHAHTGPRKNPGKPPVAPLEREIRRMFVEAGFYEPFKVRWWGSRDEQSAKKRDYAMVDPQKADFLFSQRILALDDAHRTAILAHEVGHVLAFHRWGDDSEKGADRAANEFLGVEIAYDKAFPGKGLQVCSVRRNPARPNLRESDFDLIPNPTPWVTHVLAQHYPELEDQVPPAWLPKISKTRAVGTTFTGELSEFGCGAFGCVLPTLDSSVVLKVTSDESEAEFAMQWADELPTQVTTAYYMAVKLEGSTRGPRSGVRSDGRGEPIYLLWREEAKDVGKIDSIVGPHAEAAIHRQHTLAMDAFLKLQAGDDARAALERWRFACQEMAKVPELIFVSEGLLRAEAEKRVFISDTHGGNLGQCMRNGRMEWVITDPGNVVVLRERSR